MEFTTLFRRVLALHAILELFLWASFVGAQTVIVGQPPTSTSDGGGAATPTPSQTVSTVNCTALANCTSCAAQAACGWCAVGNGQCVGAFNIFAPPGTGAAACYGNTDQYFWLQCQVGARTGSILVIGAAIIVGMALVILAGCVIRMRRRRAKEGGTFDKMVDDFERRYKKKDGNEKKGNSFRLS